MSQMQTGGPRRRSTGGGLDVFTALSLAGVVALIIATGILWIAGSQMADSEELLAPFQILSGP